jgi:Ca-activated chloride channel family protein
MTFATPQALLLLPVLLLGALALGVLRRRGSTLLAADATVARTAARPTWRLRLRALPALLRWVALGLLILALARPREGLAVTLIPEEGIDVVVSVDVSSSMTAPVTVNKTRLQAARDVVSDFVETLEGDRVGLVIFQARAVPLSPLTYDRNAIARRIDSLQPGLVDDGTAIGLGIAEALNLLRDSPARSRVVVLLTDGQNNAGEVEPAVAARMAEALGIRLYTVGFVGGPTGPGSGRVDAEALRRMAEPTGGRYFDARTEVELAAAYEEIGQLERSRVGERRFTSFRELAPPLAAGAMGLLALELLLRATWFRRHP